MSQNPSAGGASKVLGIVLAVLGLALYAILGGSDDNPSALVSVPLMVAGCLLYYRGRRQAAKAKAEAPGSPLLDSKPDVLYLRSFQTDPSGLVGSLMSWITTGEEELADVLRPFGDLIAIGRPGERLPIPGATRMYATDAEWQSVVLERLRVAPLVIIRAGNSPGLLWEIGQTIRTLPPDRVLVFVFDIRLQEYQVFASEMQTKFGLNLPKIRSSSLMRALLDRQGPSSAAPGFVMFQDDWSAKFLPLPATVIRTGYNDLRKPFSLALRPVFERHGVAWRVLGRLG